MHTAPLPLQTTCSARKCTQVVVLWHSSWGFSHVRSIYICELHRGYLEAINRQQATDDALGQACAQDNCVILLIHCRACGRLAAGPCKVLPTPFAIWFVCHSQPAISCLQVAAYIVLCRVHSRSQSHTVLRPAILVDDLRSQTGARSDFMGSAIGSSCNGSIVGRLFVLHSQDCHTLAKCELHLCMCTFHFFHADLSDSHAAVAANEHSIGCSPQSTAHTTPTPS